MQKVRSRAREGSNMSVSDSMFNARSNALITGVTVLAGIGSFFAVASVWPPRFPYETIMDMISQLTAVSMICLTICSGIVSRRKLQLKVRRIAGCLTLFLGVLTTTMLVVGLNFSVPANWESVEGKVLRIEYYKRPHISFANYGTTLLVGYDYKGNPHSDLVYTTEFIIPRGDAPKDWQTYRYQGENTKEIAKRKKWLTNVNHSLLQHTIYTDDDVVQLKVNPQNPDRAMLANWVPRLDLIGATVSGVTAFLLLVFGLITLLTDKTFRVSAGSSD